MAPFGRRNPPARPAAQAPASMTETVPAVPGKPAVTAPFQAPRRAFGNPMLPPPAAATAVPGAVVAAPGVIFPPSRRSFGTPFARPVAPMPTPLAQPTIQRPSVAMREHQGTPVFAPAPAMAITPPMPAPSRPVAVAQISPGPARVAAAPPPPVSRSANFGSAAVKAARITLPAAELDDEPTLHETGFERVNRTQVRYKPMSRVNPTGAVIPQSMAGATRKALEALSEKVGDVDAWLCGRLQWNMKQLGSYLTSEQIDAVALALDSSDRKEGIIIADQTGFGKGRALAALSRAVVLSNRKVVFLTEKANLFSDFWRDIRDINSEAAFGRPFMLNDNASIVDTSSVDARVLYPKWKHAEIDRVLAAGELPKNSNIMMATYSQFNRKGTRKCVLLEQVSAQGSIVLDESHNFVGDSTTSKTVGAAIAVAQGSTFSSATFARDVTNLSAYLSVFPWLGRIARIDEMNPAHRRALAEESVRHATELGRIIRREHDLTNMVLQISTATGERLARSVELADRLAPILSKMARLARRVDAILEERNEANRTHLETLPADQRKAEREVWLTANFGSRLNAIQRQFLTGLNVEPCIEMCVKVLLEGKRPVVVIESTMESLMRELASDDGEDDRGDSPALVEPIQGSFDLAAAAPEEETDAAKTDAVSAARPPTFRDALMLLADRLLRVSVRRGQAFEKEQVILDENGLAAVRDEILDMASLFPQLSLSPIDDLRDGVETASRRLFAEGRIDKLWSAEEISARGMRVVGGNYVKMPASDRNQIVARFVNGATQMLVLTQAASTGLSIHDSEKFLDHAQKVMIELEEFRNVVARIQMWGRVWRRGQLTEPEFAVLDTGLPFHSYSLAASNRKLSELSASVTGTGRATVSLDLPDPIDAVGNDVAHELLQEQQSLTEEMGISLNVDKENADRELYFVGKLFRRLPLLSVEKQSRVCKAFYAAYDDRIKAGADTQHGRHLEGHWTPVRREILEAGDGSADPISGGDVYVTTLRSFRDAEPMTAAAVVSRITEAQQNSRTHPTRAEFVEKLRGMRDGILQAALPKRRFKTVGLALASPEDNAVKKAATKLSDMITILSEINLGCAALLPIEDGEMAKGVIVGIQHPPLERANVAREHEVVFVVPGDERPRSVSLDTIVRERKSRILGKDAAMGILSACDQAPSGNVAVERKVLDGNGIGAILASRRIKCGTRTTYSDLHGRSRTAILLPRSAEREIASVPGQTALSEVAAHILSLGGRLLTDAINPADGVSLIPDARGGGVTVTIPSSKRAAKPFETEAMLALTGPFTGDWTGRQARVPRDKVAGVLTLLGSMHTDFSFPAEFRSAAVEKTRDVIIERQRVHGGAMGEEQARTFSR
jgi:hypothetical protein